MTAPILLTACVAIIFESPGSPVYRQQRMGRADSVPVLEPRTLVPDAHRIGPELTQHGDSRITRVGSVLRRWSLDELPQLVNVLAGHMSLVGPRAGTGLDRGFTPRSSGRCCASVRA